MTTCKFFSFGQFLVLEVSQLKQSITNYKSKAFVVSPLVKLYVKYYYFLCFDYYFFLQQKRDICLSLEEKGYLYT